MATTAEFFDALASLLTYPGLDYRFQARECLRHAPPEAEPFLDAFTAEIDALPVEQIQELFTRTFDLNPVCSLELGWHLFGENYDRGVLLVRVRQELARHGIAESVELPDHLTHVLRLLPRMRHDRGADFAGACVLPALHKMLAAFANKDNAFENLLRAAEVLILRAFPDIEPAKPQPLLRVLAGRS